MSLSCKDLFEHALLQRGVAFSVDASDGRYLVDRRDGTRLLVSLDNLSKEFERDRDAARIGEFVDIVLARSGNEMPWERARNRILLSLEPNDYADRSALAREVSKRVDRVPVLHNEDAGTIAWVTPQMLERWSISHDHAHDLALANLQRELLSSKLECAESDGVMLGYLASNLPFKSSLILAPGFRAFVESHLGWPLFAVIPSRDFMYFWSTNHPELFDRVGPVVVKENVSSPYPVSREVFEVTDLGLRAIGEFGDGA